MQYNDIKEIIKKHKPSLIDRYRIKEIGLFGSYVRNEATENSDIDILVDFKSPISLFDFIDMEDELSELLKTKVDLVSKKALKPNIGKRILQEVQNI